MLKHIKSDRELAGLVARMPTAIRQALAAVLWWDLSGGRLHYHRLHALFAVRRQGHWQPQHWEQPDLAELRRCLLYLGYRGVDRRLGGYAGIWKSGPITRIVRTDDGRIAQGGAGGRLVYLPTAAAATYQLEPPGDMDE